MKLINLTSHSITELTTGTTIAPSGIVARVEQTSVISSRFHTIPIYKSTYGEIVGLPEPEKDTRYIVSAMCLNAIPSWRTDVVSPGYVKRDEQGNVKGCIGFKIKD